MLQKIFNVFDVSAVLPNTSEWGWGRSCYQWLNEATYTIKQDHLRRPSGGRTVEQLWWASQILPSWQGRSARHFPNGGGGGNQLRDLELKSKRVFPKTRSALVISRGRGGMESQFGSKLWLCRLCLIRGGGTVIFTFMKAAIYPWVAVMDG